MRAPLLASVLLACAPARPAPVVAPTPAAVAAPKPTLHGALLVHGPFGIATCKPTCAMLEDPKLARPHHVPRRIAPGLYLFEEGTFHFEDGTLEPLPSPVEPKLLHEGAFWALDGGAFVHVEHLPTADRLRVSRGGGAFAPLQESIPPKSYDFRFLPDGRHLFKSAPLIGKQESPWFIDVIEGQSVTLSYVPSLGGEPKKLVARPQTLHADFVADGATIVYWVPGTVDEAKNTRRVLLEAVDVASGKTVGLGSVTGPAIAERFGSKVYLRDTPRTLHHVHSRFIVHEASLDASATARAVRVVDVPAARSFEVTLADDETLVSSFDDSHAYYGGSRGRRDEDVLILARPDPQGTRVRVLSLPALEVVLEVLVPGAGVQAVDFVRDR